MRGVPRNAPYDVPFLGIMVWQGKRVQNGTVLRPSAPYHLGMTVKELTLQQLLSVSCSTCGAAPGEQCVLHYGGVRFAPHPTRKFDQIRNERLCGLIAMEQGEIAKLKMAARLKKNARSLGLLSNL
jgi:hypothetical protein